MRQSKDQKTKASQKGRKPRAMGNEIVRFSFLICSLICQNVSHNWFLLLSFSHTLIEKETQIYHLVAQSICSDVDDLGFMRPWSPIEESGCQKQYETWYAAYLPIVVRRRCRWEKENPRRNSHLCEC